MLSASTLGFGSWRSRWSVPQLSDPSQALDSWITGGQLSVRTDSQLLFPEELTYIVREPGAHPLSKDSPGVRGSG